MGKTRSQLKTRKHIPFQPTCDPNLSWNVSWLLKIIIATYCDIVTLGMYCRYDWMWSSHTHYFILGGACLDSSRWKFNAASFLPRQVCSSTQLMTTLKQLVNVLRPLPCPVLHRTIRGAWGELDGCGTCEWFPDAWRLSRQKIVGYSPPTLQPAAVERGTYHWAIPEHPGLALLTDVRVA